ncbi:haloalkane dehalogenase [Mycobacterium interjectum]|jgi:haloalkane dehalogenase|nr:haloalkane dehalogenase [Mycobacterium interjectum]
MGIRSFGRVSADARQIVEHHRRSGMIFRAADVGSFVLDRGDGVPVVCLHGVPTSSFLYRKVVDQLAARGLRGVALDFPGLGLAERPQDFDYSWSGLARWTAEAIDALGIDRCHLLVHDIGGPIGFEWAITHPDRVLSMTVLNTPVDVATFHRPWPMHPFSIKGVGEAWLACFRWPLLQWMTRLTCLVDQSAMSDAEIQAGLLLMRGTDNGRAFLRIMRGFELTSEKEAFYRHGLASRSYPAQVVWGAQDRMLDRERRAAVVCALGADSELLLPAKHYLQEDHAPAIAGAVKRIAALA